MRECDPDAPLSFETRGYFRYVGQGWEVPVDIPEDAAADRARLERAGATQQGLHGMVAQAQVQLRAGMASLIDRFPDVNAHYADYGITTHAGVGLPVSLRAGTARTMRLLFGVVTVLLLIACANVANLLLSRGVARQGETVMRRALGASGARLVQQHLVEGMVVSLLGGALGIAVAAAVGSIFQAQSLLGLPVIDGLTMDWRVITFALAGAILTGMIFTLAPALAALRARQPGQRQPALVVVAGEICWVVRLPIALPTVRVTREPRREPTFVRDAARRSRVASAAAIRASGVRRHGHRVRGATGEVRARAFVAQRHVARAHGGTARVGGMGAAVRERRGGREQRHRA